MATITAYTISILPSKRLANLSSSSSASVIGLPPMRVKNGKVGCSMNEKAMIKPRVLNLTLIAAAASSAAMAVFSSDAAMALVDERMSTEGTGLPLGLSNNILGWIIVGVFGTIWTLYYSFITTLEEDEDSGLRL